MAEKKYFPIRTETACQLKWAWSTVNLALGETSSCHRVNNHRFDIDSFNFHNTAEKVNQRELMLNGQWPKAGCNYCEGIEKTGIGQSDRQFFLNVPDLSPPELDSNPIATVISPTILEVYIDNACNLSCVYCIPRLSSRIDTEMKKFGRFEKNGLVLESTYKKNQEFDRIQQQFWEWMGQHARGLKRLHLLGGEPFYQRQFESFLEFFENNACPELEFNIVTNLMISKDKLSAHIERFKRMLIARKVKRIDITVSIDCWGPQQEYVRHGMDIELFRTNLEYLLDQRWLTINVNNTLSVLTIKTLPDLMVIMNEYGKHRKIEHYFSAVIYPSYLHYNILGPDEFRDDFQKVLSLMEGDSWRGAHARTHMEGLIATNTNSVYNKEETLKLLTFLDENDRRRNTNWKVLFPWLERYTHVV